MIVSPRGVTDKLWIVVAMNAYAEEKIWNVSRNVLEGRDAGVCMGAGAGALKGAEAEQ